MILDFKKQDCDSMLVDCRYNSMKEVLDYYKFDLEVYDIFLLSHSFTFKYVKVDLKNEGIYGIPMVALSNDDIEYSLFDTLGIPYKKDVLDDSDESWRKIKKLISDKTPVIFKLDERIVKNDEAILNEHIKYRFLSIPVMYGYDKDTVHLFWSWASNSEDLFIDFPLERFNKYRNTLCLPNSPKYRCCYIDGDCISDKNMDIDNIINESIKLTAKKMLFGDSENEEIGLMYSSEVISGLQAMKQFGDDLKHCYKKLVSSDQEYKKFVILSVLLLRNVMLNGSKCAYRIELGKAIKRFGTRTDNQRLTEIGEGLSASAKKWQKMLAFMGKLVRRKEDFSEGFNTFISLYYEIYEDEKRLFGSLGELYGFKCV